MQNYMEYLRKRLSMIVILTSLDMSHRTPGKNRRREETYFVPEELIDLNKNLHKFRRSILISIMISNEVN